MRIRLITPAPPRSRSGNRATAARWAAILRRLGHRLDISVDYQDQPADMMIALHAWRSADSIARFAGIFPDRPLIVAITGTDAYRFIHTHPQPTLRSIALATRLVGLHALIGETLPAEHRDKMRVIYQSALPIARRSPVKRSFRVCVAGHLREEKDPLRPALAVRELPADSRIRIEHYGKPHTPEWADRAREEMARNPRYRWHGEIAHHAMRRVYASSHLLALPSRMEGGANVISEAIAAELPVVASDIHGSIGLLGSRYPGLYPVEDAGALGKLMLRAETDPEFYRTLQQACAALKGLFTPRREFDSWRELLREIDP